VLILPMEIREFNDSGRTIEGICIPYDETSYLTPNPDGERVKRGAFTKSAEQRLGKIFLYVGHDHAHPIGRTTKFEDRADGLAATFHIRESVLGDQALTDVREGYLPGLSVGFRPLQARRASDGATEIVEGQLMEVSLVPIAAYDGARVLAVRTAWNATHGLAAPAYNLAPVVPGWAL
jgi:HK97 family phage prohead protease